MRELWRDRWRQLRRDTGSLFVALIVFMAILALVTLLIAAAVLAEAGLS
jgi:preprotein translocase subunit SecE